jgi:excisionase family DNA binding protein
MSCPGAESARLADPRRRAAAHTLPGVGDLERAVGELLVLLDRAESGDSEAARLVLAAAAAAEMGRVYLTVAEVAVQWRLSERTVRRAIDAGSLVAEQTEPGGAIRIRVAEVVAWRSRRRPCP